MKTEHINNYIKYKHINNYILIIALSKNKKVNKMIKWIRELASKHNDVSSIPSTCMMEKFPYDIFRPSHGLCNANTPINK